MSDLYETDILLWAEHQTDLLLRLAAGERVNDQVDWENIVEEIESVGREQLHAVESLLFQALLHMVKAAGWPLARDVENWQADARGCRTQARRRFAPSVRQKIDVTSVYQDAVKALPALMDGQPPLPLPTTCSMTLDELLDNAP
jgi:Domain of unknown function DUF29